MQLPGKIHIISYDWLLNAYLYSLCDSKSIDKSAKVLLFIILNHFLVEYSGKSCNCCYPRDFVKSFVTWWHFCDVFPHIVWWWPLHTFCITWRKKGNGVTDFHGNVHNSISFVLWSWNRQRIVSLTSNYGFKKAWVTWHMVMYVQFLLCQTTFASRKKTPGFCLKMKLGEERLLMVGFIGLMQVYGKIKQSTNTYLSPTFPNWIPDLQLLLLY